MKNIQSKIEMLYQRCQDDWVGIQQMGLMVGLDGDGHAAILEFVAQPDVEHQDRGGIRVYRTKQQG